MQGFGYIVPAWAVMGKTPYGKNWVRKCFTIEIDGILYGKIPGWSNYVKFASKYGVGYISDRSKDMVYVLYPTKKQAELAVHKVLSVQA